MDEIILFWMNFGWSMTLLVFLIFLQITFINKTKDKTDLNTNLLYFLFLFEGFTPFILVFVNVFGGILIMIIIPIVWLIKFMSEQWYKDRMYLKGDYNVRLKFLNHEAESEIVNIYKKKDTQTKTIDKTLRTNMEIIEKLTSSNFYADIIDIYLDIHPELTLKDLESDIIDISPEEATLLEENKKLKEEVEKLKTPRKPKTKKITKPKKPPISALKEELEDLEEKETQEEYLRDKNKALNIFKRIFKDMYFHRRFFQFEFLELELEEELSYDVQALILSFREDLPRDLLLTCGLLEEEIVLGKKFTTIFCIEGILDEEIAKKINAKITDLEIFKAFPSWFKIDTLSNRIEAQDIRIEGLEEEVKLAAAGNLQTSAIVERHRKRYEIYPTNHDRSKKKKRFKKEEEDF